MIEDTIKQVYQLALNACPWGSGTCTLSWVINNVNEALICEQLSPIPLKENQWQHEKDLSSQFLIANNTTVQ